MKQPPSHDDEAAILRAALNDLNHFAPLYERYVDRIYAYCLRRVANAADAEDLTSLIFTRAMMGLHDYRGGSVAAWLFRIAHNAVVNYYRDCRPQISVPDEDDIPVEIALRFDTTLQTLAELNPQIDFSDCDFSRLSGGLNCVVLLTVGDVISVPLYNEEAATLAIFPTPTPIPSSSPH